MKTDIEVLDGAIALIEKDGAWCQGAFCRDANGYEVLFPMLVKWEEPVPALSAKPESFCLEGAIGFANGWFLTQPNAPAAAKLAGQWGRLLDLLRWHGLPEDRDLTKGWDIAAYNDLETTSQEDAILALKRTRSFLEGQE